MAFGTGEIRYYRIFYVQASQKYPLLVYVYGGPGSQSVDQKWKIGYEDYLTSNYGIVYAIIDGRGTGFQSNDYMFEVRIILVVSK